MARTVKVAEKLIEMTQEAYDNLVKELHHRVDVLREEIANEISEARKLGDLSENHAYTIAMEKREMNENKILDLEETIKYAKIVSSSNNGTVVRVGSKVELINVDTKRSMFVELVGSEQTQSAVPEAGKISVESPIGQAIHNANIGDVVIADLPSKKVKFKISKFAA